MTNPVSPARIEAAAKTLDERHPDVTARQKELVQLLVQQGGTNRAAAEAMTANESWVSQTLQKPHVAAYANDLAKSVLSTHALRAVSTAASLLEARSERIRLEAAQDIMNRAGLGQPETRSQPVSVNIKL